MIPLFRFEIRKFCIDRCRAKAFKNERKIYLRRKEKETKIEIKLIDSKLNINLKTSDDSFVKAYIARWKIRREKLLL